MIDSRGTAPSGNASSGNWILDLAGSLTLHLHAELLHRSNRRAWHPSRSERPVGEVMSRLSSSPSTFLSASAAHDPRMPTLRANCHHTLVLVWPHRPLAGGAMAFRKSFEILDVSLRPSTTTATIRDASIDTIVQ